LPFVPEWAEPVWHLFVVRPPRRKRLQEKLAAAGIGTLIHYPVPPHLSGAYAGGKWRRGDFPITENLADTVLSLPMGPHLAAEQVSHVIRKIKRSWSAANVRAASGFPWETLPENKFGTLVK
jgi:dTDP-4-amino-4,6-dideoxygalactose transaminase